jgi:hypothetical protein
MKHLCAGISFSISLFIVISMANAQLLGIRWDNSWLVSFNPDTGSITNYHVQLNSNESFRGLTYDPNHKELYASSQVSLNLYSINPASLNVKLIGRMNSTGDISSLAYNPRNNTLYAMAVNVFGKSELLSVNVKNAALSKIGEIQAPYVNSISYNEMTGQLNAYAVYGSGSWDSPFKSSVVSIDPSNANMTTLFETPYHTILGLAKKPGENSFYTWVNWSTHFYAKVDMSGQTIIPLGNADSVFVASDAMIYRSFSIRNLR